MDTKKYESIIEAFWAQFVQAQHLETEHLTIPDYKGLCNMALLCRKGSITVGYGQEKVVAGPGDVLFVPELQRTRITYGDPDGVVISNEQLVNNPNKYFDEVEDPNDADAVKSNLFSYITFEVKIHDAINFFNFINVGPFVIRNNPEVQSAMEVILEESTKHHIAKKPVLALQAKQLAVYLMRYILEERLFLDQVVLKLSALSNERLTKLFDYIAKNIESDLSNAALATQVGYTKDYIGQFFKKVTKINLQDYVEMTRLNKALELVRSTDKKVQQIKKEVGYQDISYFCRRFNSYFGIPAGKMRRRNILADELKSLATDIA